MLENEPFQETLSQPSLGAGQPAEVSHVVTLLLDEFHLLTQEVALQEVTELRICAGRPQWPSARKGPGSGSSPGPQWLPWCPEFHPTHLGVVSAHPGRGQGRCAGFASSSDAQCPHASP